MKARQKYGTLQTLAADLVINASGRNTQLPKWLETLGYPQAPETVINSFLGYASRWYRPNTVGDAIQGVIVSNKPGVTCRGGFGQGMTVAALGALDLGRCLAQTSSLDAGFSHGFQRCLAKVLAPPWLMATGEDFR